MKRLEELSPALQLCVRALRRRPHVTFALLRQQAWLTKGIKLWPIQFGRAIEWLRHRGEITT